MKEVSLPAIFNNCRGQTTHKTQTTKIILFTDDFDLVFL